jgi:membrane protease subunit HflC
MQAYEAGIKPGDTRMLLAPDSEFFKYFNSPGANPSTSPAANAGTSPGATASPPQAGGQPKQ